MIALRGLLLTMIGWVAIGIVTALGGGETANPFAPGFLILCALFLLTPLGLALPAGRLLAAPGWTSEVIIAWAGLGYLLCCVDPSRLGHGWALMLLLPTLVGALASPTFLLAAYWPRPTPRHLRLQGYLLSGGVSALLLFHALGAIAVLTLLLLGLLLMLARALILTRAQRTNTQHADPGPMQLSHAPEEAAPMSASVPPTPLRALPRHAASGD